MDNSSNQDDSLRIYASDNEMVQKVCQLLSTPKSNKIYNTCMDKQLNAKEIAKIIEGEENPRLPGYVVHLKNMVEVGLLRVEEKEQRKKGHVLKFYKSVPFVIIVPPQHVEKAKNSRTLRNTFRTVFKEGIKFAAVGIASITSYFLSFKEKIVDPDGYLPFSETPVSNNESSYTIPLIVLIIGLCILYILEKRKKERNDSLLKI